MQQLAVVADLKTTELLLVARGRRVRRVLAHLFENVPVFEGAGTMPVVVDIPEAEILSEIERTFWQTKL
jgi:hypothetical protein